MKQTLSRRDFVGAGFLAALSAAGAALFKTPLAQAAGETHHLTAENPGMQNMPEPQGEVDHLHNGFNPSGTLYDFDYGRLSRLASGQPLREYQVIATDHTIEIMPGIEFPAWAYNGRIPGPTLRCTEGDRLRIKFINASTHPHSMHFHGIHPAEMDGVPGAGPGLIPSGSSFTYEFDAYPFGLHLYHCHAFPLARHIAKGLYGAFIIDPQPLRPAVEQEMVMVMHGFDVDFDNHNDFYAVNGIPFHYQKHPIPLRVGEQVRLYLVNILEYDLLNSFHLHANFFHYYPTGTRLEPSEYTDTILQTQAQRGILEFAFQQPGMYMFHAHNTEFAELGWTGAFEVLPREASRV